MIKINITSLSTLLVLTFAILLPSCKKDSPQNYSPIKIGEDATSLSEITINRSSRKILLSGGNNKYSATAADSKIASVTVEKDSLIVTGLQEGKTFATIMSHNYTQRLDINVTFPPITFSQPEMLIYPDRLREDTSVKLSGGGITPSLSVYPEGVINIKWDAQTEVVVITALRVGDALVTAKDEKGNKAELKVKVRPDDFPQKYGIYGTTGRYLEQNYKLKAVFVSKKDNGEIIMASGSSPKGGNIDMGVLHKTPTTVISIAKVSGIEEGKTVTIKVTHRVGDKKIETGTYECMPEKFGNNQMYFIHPDFIFYLP